MEECVSPLFLCLYSRGRQTARLSPVRGNRGKYGSTETRSVAAIALRAPTTVWPLPRALSSLPAKVWCSLRIQPPHRRALLIASAGDATPLAALPPRGARGAYGGRLPLLYHNIPCTRATFAQQSLLKLVQNIDALLDRAYSIYRNPLDEVQQGAVGGQHLLLAHPRRRVRPAPLLDSGAERNGEKARRSDSPAAMFHDRGGTQTPPSALAAACAARRSRYVRRDSSHRTCGW